MQTQAPAPQANQLPDTAHAVHAAEAAMADKINQELAAKPAEAPVEAPKEEPKAPEPAADPMGKRLAFLAKKERETIQLRKQVTTQAKEVEALKLQLQKAIEDQRAFFLGLEKDPLSVLEAKGLSYDKLTEAKLKGKPVDTTAYQIQLLKNEVEQAKAEQARKEELAAQNAVQAQTAAAQAAVESYRNEINEFIAATPDYADLNDDQGKADVFQLVDLWAEKTGKVLSVKEAAQMVLDQRIEEDTKAAERAAQRTARLAAAKPKEAAPVPEKPKATTLTNQMSASSTAAGTGGIVSEAEAIRRALASIGRTA